MGLMDFIRGVIGEDGIQSVLDSTGLADHVEALGGDVGAGAEALAGGDLGAGAEALAGEELAGGAEALAGGDLGAGAEALGVEVPDVTDSLTNPP